jgi:hypothetical protein
MHAQERLARPGNDRIQLAMLHDYGSAVSSMPPGRQRCAASSRASRSSGGPEARSPGRRRARLSSRSAKRGTYLLDAGHFALESLRREIAAAIGAFFGGLWHSPSHRGRAWPPGRQLRWRPEPRSEGLKATYSLARARTRHRKVENSEQRADILLGGPEARHARARDG